MNFCTAQATRCKKMHRSFAVLLGFGRVYQERTVILFPVHSHRCEDTPFPLRPPFGTRSSCDRPTHDSVMGGTNDVRPSFSPGCPLLGTRDLLYHSVDSSNDRSDIEQDYILDFSCRYRSCDSDWVLQHLYARALVLIGRPSDISCERCTLCHGFSQYC